MPVGTPVVLGTGSTAVSGDTVTVVAVTSAPAGATVLVWLTHTGGNAPSSVTDDAGNTYSLLETSPTAANGTVTWVYRKFGAAAISIGTVFTGTYAGGATSLLRYMAVLYPDGVNAADGSALSSGSTPWAVGPTATLVAADEVAIAFVWSSTSSGSNTPLSGWTELIDANIASQDRAIVQYKIVSSTAAVSTSGTGGGTFTAILDTFYFALPSQSTVQMVV